MSEARFFNTRSSHPIAAKDCCYHPVSFLGFGSSSTHLSSPSGEEFQDDPETKSLTGDLGQEMIPTQVQEVAAPGLLQMRDSKSEGFGLRSQTFEKSKSRV
ncbi:hypothetical protein JTE90_016035 [Oedothorax gibbosus]|uniref:Uncharacterized protein n=1 Tax=Oedothorax gibbosus TaxID=931172 RepID=A0AAV6VTX2_9ARAC|nr:hypothetical protein JTE90_016035 [Oedothorax gibbosus]